jgi:hypothetical protein
MQNEDENSVNKSAFRVIIRCTWRKAQLRRFVKLYIGRNLEIKIFFTQNIILKLIMENITFGFNWIRRLLEQRFHSWRWWLQVLLARENALNVQYLSTAEAISSVSEPDIFHFNIHNYGRAYRRDYETLKWDSRGQWLVILVILKYIFSLSSLTL